MKSLPLLRQLFVASAPQLAAISMGGIVCFPGALFPQLTANDSNLHLDIHAASWIGSTHGLAGIVAWLLPLLMQHKGRKLSFILSCLFGLTGWVMIYLAQSVEVLIVAEMFHGLCTYSVIICSLQTISEMVQPRIRIILMNMYIFFEALGMNLVFVAGRYLSWKVICLIECCPIILALLICLTWPDSPAWLANRGEFEKCEAAFKWLRGTDADTEELSELIRSNKERLAQHNTRIPFKISKINFGSIWMKIRRRDFYLPCLHTFLLICAIYWSGVTFVLIYAMGMLKQVTGSESAASIGSFVIYSIVVIGNLLALLALKFCKNKTILIVGCSGVSFFMIAASIISFLQENKILASTSLLCLYCLIGYTIMFNLGMIISCPSIAAEVMPIKHRGLGGAFYVLCISLLDFWSLKLSPYLFVYIKPSGTFLIYGLNALICMLLIWRFIPETKNRTLQEIEDFYNHGHFAKCRSDGALDKLKDSNAVD